MPRNEQEGRLTAQSNVRVDSINSATCVRNVVSQWVNGEISYDRMKREYFTIEAREILGRRQRDTSRRH